MNQDHPGTQDHGNLTVIEDGAVVPFDNSPAEFKAALDRRGTNRQALMAWVRASLKETVDYGRIQTKRGLSKPSLWKPGAEKICGMMGLKAEFPRLRDYEEAVIQGIAIDNIIMRCVLMDSAGNIVSEGVGARSVNAEGGDLNKALKMACKSAHIDATLRCAGLSEVFTQDTEYEPEDAVKPEVQTSPEPAPAAAAKLITDNQARLLYSKCKEKRIPEVVFCEYFGIIKREGKDEPTLRDLPFAKMNAALAYLDGK